MKKLVGIILLLILNITVLLKAELYDWNFIVINSKVITFFEFKTECLKVKETFIKYGKPIPSNLQSMIFNKLINNKIIELAALKKEVFISDAEVDKRIENIKSLNRLSDKAFKEALKQEGKTLEELKENIKNQILTEKIMNLEVRGEVSEPTDEEIKEYYNKHKKEMVSPEKIKISHILIMDNPNASLKERTARKKLAKKILKLALSGKDFASLAKKYSQDETSKDLGGNIGYIGKGEWLPEIDAKLFTLGKGEIFPQVLRSRWGWHIVKVTDKKRKRHIPFDEVKEKLKNVLFQQKMQEKFLDWLNNQRNTLFIKVILPDEEVYSYSYNKWKNINTGNFISNDEMLIKINSIKL